MKTHGDENGSIVSDAADPWSRWSSYVLFGVGFGLFLGLTESLLHAAERHLHLVELTAVKPFYEWAPSVAYTCIFGVTCAAAGLVIRFLPDAWKTRFGLRSMLMGCLVAYWFVTVDILDTAFEVGLNGISQLILALGLASVTSGWLVRRLEGLFRAVCYGIPVLAVVVAAWAAAVHTAPHGRSRNGSAQRAAAAGAPNVVLIVWDTVRAESLSLYGYGRETTPTLARLAKSGVVFDRAVAGASWTLPSHAGMFTGLPHHEFPDIVRRGLPDRFTTLAEALQQRGYLTAGFVANRSCCHRYTGLNQGFTHYDDAQLTLTRMFGRAQLVRCVWDEWLGPLYRKKNVPLKGAVSAQRINRALLEWRDRNPGRPFFAFLNYFDAHDPYYPPEPFRQTYGPSSDEDYDVLANWHHRLMSGQRPTAEQLRVARSAYEGCIAYLDQQLGELLADLDRRGELNNTLVIITSDHGEAFGEHGLYWHGTSLYQQQTHVPLVMLFPGRIPQGLRVQESIGLVDIPATVLDLLGIEDSPFPGTSLARCWTSQGGREACLPVLSELEPHRWNTLIPNSHAAKGPVRAVWFDTRKYMRGDSDGMEALYDLASDPGENQNLASGSGQAAVLRQLQAHLARLAPGNRFDGAAAATASRSAAGGTSQSSLR